MHDTKPSDAELRRSLKPIAVSGDSARSHRAAVPQRVLGNHRAGIYVDSSLGAAVQLARPSSSRHRVAQLHAGAQQATSPRRLTAHFS